MERIFLTSLTVIGLFCSSVASADGGMVVWPPDVHLDQTAQNAIIAWNGEEEIIILSNGIKSDEPATALRVVPLPSNPEIKEGSFKSFEKIVGLMNEKLEDMRDEFGGIGKQNEIAAPGDIGIEITFHEQIGAHDVTVVKVNDLDVFVNWINDFSDKNGFEKNREIKCGDFDYFDCPNNCIKDDCYMPICLPGHSCVQECQQVCRGGTVNTHMISKEFKDGIADYLKRDIKYFVFDVVEAGKDTEESIEPLIYKFESDYLYYPLLISGISDIGESRAHIDLFFIADKGVEWPEDFGYSVEFSKQELNEVSEDLASLFNDSVEVSELSFYETLTDIRTDLLAFPSFYFESSDIGLGVYSDGVEALQKLLINAQVWDSTVGATGYFGPITQKALAKAQEKFKYQIGLEQATGYFDPKTRDFFKGMSIGIEKNIKPQAYGMWSRNLTVGARGDDVKELQRLLISEGVWDSTVGATGYFGPITKSAVIRFQTKYSSDILAPIGLTNGTGFVGSFTRAYLNRRY